MHTSLTKVVMATVAAVAGAGVDAFRVVKVVYDAEKPDEAGRDMYGQIGHQIGAQVKDLL